MVPALKDELQDVAQIRTRQYRRGAIMGLTVAESFILLAFVLLLLLLAWRAIESRQTEEWGRFLQQFESISEVGAQDAMIRRMISNHDAIEQKLARLVEEEVLIQLIDAVRGLPRTQRREFDKLASVEDYDEIINWLLQIAGWIEQGINPNDLAERISKLLGNVERTKREIAERIERASGERIRGLGGTVDLETGIVTLPEAALFEQGRSDIRSQLASFLRDFCPEWLSGLMEDGQSIESVRIEGHASSEWRLGVDSQTAFLRNMDLSQRRAANVLEFCLRRVGGGDLGEWSRSKLVAVGMSSSRLVRRDDGSEDPVKSRRVIFGYEIDQDQVLSGIREEIQVSVPVEAPSTVLESAGQHIQGTPRIIDGDTIEIDGTRIRLQGLHAPEIDEPGGREAAEYLAEFVGTAAVICTLDGSRTYDREVGQCYLGEVDVAEELVRHGLARDCPAFSKGRYAPFETSHAQNTMPLPSYCI